MARLRASGGRDGEGLFPAARHQIENERWAAQNGPVMVRRIGEPLEAARPLELDGHYE